MPRRTQDPTRFTSHFSYRACTFFGRPFNAVRLCPASLSVVLLPRSSDRFGLLRFRSPLLTESLLFSFPPGTKMFQFPGLYSFSLCVLLQMPPHCRWRVSPFGYPRFVACLRLPEAFRRLLRPSSALYAKTSAVRSSSFNHYISRDMSSFRELLLLSCSFQHSSVFFFQLYRKTYLSFLLFSFQRSSLLRCLSTSQNQPGIPQLRPYTSFSLERR